MNKKYLIFWILAVIVFVMAIGLASNPLRYSEETITSQLLSATPLRTSMQEVENFIHNEGWEVVYISEIYGFYDQRTSPAQVVGSQSIRANLGDYFSIPFETNVTVFWGFNEQSELIDIWVWKTVDAL